MVDDAKTRKDRARELDRLIGHRLTSARVSTGVGLRDLAAAIGVSVETAEEFEAGARRIDPVHLVCAATYLRVSLAYLFRDDQAIRTAPSQERTSRR